MSARRPLRPKAWHVCLLLILVTALLVAARTKWSSTDTILAPQLPLVLKVSSVAGNQEQNVDHASLQSQSFRNCDFAAAGGTWEQRGMIDGDGDGGDVSNNATATILTKPPVKEHLLYWHPRRTTTQRCIAREGSSLRSWRRFSQADALRCLEGKQLLFYGNSNTRTVYIALEALLRNKRMTSRVAAKQMCDNSKTNHSCWATIEINGYKPIRASYVSYVQDLFHEELDRKIPLGKRKTFDLIIGNSGLNAIQNNDNKKVRDDHLANVPKLRKYIASFAKVAEDREDVRLHDPMFLWHATTPICPNQPHFKRYLYNAKHWRYRNVDQINEAVKMSNKIVFEQVFGVPFLSSLSEEGRGVVDADGAFTVEGLDIGVVDDWSMMVKRLPGDGGGAPFDLCPFFEDPLHHRFLDREVVQNLLNMYCPFR